MTTAGTVWENSPATFYLKCQLSFLVIVYTRRLLRPLITCTLSWAIIHCITGWFLYLILSPAISDTLILDSFYLDSLHVHDNFVRVCERVCVHVGLLKYFLLSSMYHAGSVSALQK